MLAESIISRTIQTSIIYKILIFSFRYGEQSANKKAHLDSNNFQNENFHQNGADNAGNSDSKIAHHKGHHKSGFSNSYHKDESGSNSSFFDDGSDEGDQVERKNYRGLLTFFEFPPSNILSLKKIIFGYSLISFILSRENENIC